MKSLYGYNKEVRMDFSEAIKKTSEILKDEGFGILTMIDVKEKMKEKLGVDMEEYVILGACNPGLAKKAIDVEIEIGLLLPCNVIVYKKNGKVFVSAMMPKNMMGVIGKRELDDVAEQAEEKLRRVIDKI